MKLAPVDVKVSLTMVKGRENTKLLFCNIIQSFSHKKYEVRACAWEQNLLT